MKQLTREIKILAIEALMNATDHMQHGRMSAARHLRYVDAVIEMLDDDDGTRDYLVTFRNDSANANNSLIYCWLEDYLFDIADDADFPLTDEDC